MDIALPDGRRGRALALAITVLVLAALWLGIVAPLIGWHATLAERLEERRALAARMAALVQSLPALQAQAAGGATKAPPASAMLTGSTDAIAGATLQERVQTMATGAGANVNSAEMLPTEAEGAYRRIGLRLSLNGTQWPVLVHLLQAITQAAPRMLIDDLQFRSLTAIEHGGGGPPIDASFTVWAFRPATAAPATP